MDSGGRHIPASCRRDLGAQSPRFLPAPLQQPSHRAPTPSALGTWLLVSLVLRADPSCRHQAGSVRQPHPSPHPRIYAIVSIKNQLDDEGKTEFKFFTGCWGGAGRCGEQMTKHNSKQRKCLKRKHTAYICTIKIKLYRLQNEKCPTLRSLLSLNISCIPS